MKKYLSFDIGGTMVKYGLLETNTSPDTSLELQYVTVIETSEYPTEALKGGRYVVNKVKEVIKEYSTQHTLSGICISTAGLVNPVEGSIIYAEDSISNYSGLKVKEIIEESFNIPCEIENDVNCAGLSEQYMGAAKGSKITLCLTIGTGIGGCILIDGNILHGHAYSGGEVGYMSIKDSIFQNQASTTALIRDVATKKGIKDLSLLNGKRVFDLAKSGDEDCIIAIDNLCNVLAEGMANICYIINPQVIVLGGGIMVQQEYLKPKLEAALKKYLLDIICEKTKIVFAHNGNWAGLIGAYFNFVKIRQGRGKIETGEV